VWEGLTCIAGGSHMARVRIQAIFKSKHWPPVGSQQENIKELNLTYIVNRFGIRFFPITYRRECRPTETLISAL
jgi:hypothetical protein